LAGLRRARQDKKRHWRAMRRVSWREPGDYPRMVVLDGGAYGHDRSTLMRLFSEAQFAVAATDGTSDGWGMKLDKIDIKILCELQKNGRISNVELAELVNLSASPCLMRVKKLQADGYITGYSAQVDVSRLGQTLTVFTEITLRNHRQNDFARFLSTIEKVESVVECHLVSGGYDYLVKFVTPGITEYQMIMERLVELDIGIDKFFSFVVLKSPIVKVHLPLDAIFNSTR